MKATIKGMEKVDYISKKTGLPVDGVTFHIEHKDPYVVGLCAEQIFMHSKALENLGCVITQEKFKDAVGKTLEYEYNRFGMVSSVVVSG